MEEIELPSREGWDGVIGNGVVLLDFNAPWCGPCRAQEPILDELQGVFRDRARIASVNIDRNREIALNLGIQSIPTIILFNGGVEVERFVGLQTVDTLSHALIRVLHDTSVYR